MLVILVYAIIYLRVTMISIILDVVKKLFFGVQSVTPGGQVLQGGNFAILITAIATFTALPEGPIIVLDKNTLAFIFGLLWILLEMNRRAKTP